MQKLRTIAVFFLFFMSSLGAVDFDRPLSLGELVDVALENQPATKLAWWNAKRAAAAVGNEKADIILPLISKCLLCMAAILNSLTDPIQIIQF